MLEEGQWNRVICRRDGVGQGGYNADERGRDRKQVLQLLLLSLHAQFFPFWITLTHYESVGTVRKIL